VKQEKQTKFISTEKAQRNWVIVDAKDKVLGRLATQVASIIRGKTKPTFTPNADTGDFVVVINAGQIKITGKREFQKTYKHHTGYPGGLKEVKARHLYDTKPEQMVRDAILGMLPKSKLHKRMAKKLRVFADAKHPHVAQQPQPIQVEA